MATGMIITFKAKCEGRRTSIKSQFKMNTNFYHSMKVSLKGEFGVVIKSENDGPNFIGVIRWDTDKEKDFEDWRGLYGNFIDMGG